MIIDTRRLFLKLLRSFEIDTGCDVGSMDGSDSLRFRRALPAADIVALEPNPRNFALMQADPRLRDERIWILPLAASDCDSEAPFFVVAARYERDRDLPRRGMSSLLDRSHSVRLENVVRVSTARLDRVLAGPHASARIALWIDTEGMAFEALAGASGVLDRTQLLHVEAETTPCIAAEQRLLPDVERLLADADFALLATDQPRSSPQLNALFVRAELLRTRAADVNRQLARAALHHNVRRAVRPFVPRRLRRFLVQRFDALRG